MGMKTWFLLTALALMTSGSACHPGRRKERPPKLLIMMIDAFRHDYWHMDELVGFRKFLSSGSRSRFVEPVFPSKTYPNMFTQVTGMFTESHGVVDNNLYDPDHDELFSSSATVTAAGSHRKVDVGGKSSFWWNQSEPIWTTAERNGHKTGVYFWEGCQSEIHGINVTFCQPYQSLVSMDLFDYEALYDNILRDCLFNLKNDTWNMAMVYYELVDATGHANYIDTPAFRNALMITDNIILKLLTLIELNGLKDELNVILVSDHGMMFRPQSDYDYMVNLTDRLTNYTDFDPYMGSGTIVQLWPSADKYEEVYHNLTHEKVAGMKVYSKEELPDRFGIKNNNRTSPLLLVAEAGHNINNFGSPWTEHGLHGYDPANFTEMRAIFAGTGPAFKSNFQSASSMLMTDHYNIFCHVLQIDGHPNNGSIERVKDMFKTHDRQSRISATRDNDSPTSQSKHMMTTLIAVVLKMFWIQ